MRDCRREDDGVGLPRRPLRAVAVPRGVLCNKRADYEPNIKLSLLSHSRFTQPVTVGICVLDRSRDSKYTRGYSAHAWVFP